MITLLCVIVAVCVTYLITDYRRFLEIQDIKASLNLVTMNAFNAGRQAGKRSAQRDARVPMHTSN